MEVRSSNPPNNQIILAKGVILGFQKIWLNIFFFQVTDKPPRNLDRATPPASNSLPLLPTP